MAYGDEIGSVPQLFLGSDFGDMTESQSSGRMTQGPDQTVVDGDIVAQGAAALRSTFVSRWIGSISAN